MLTENRAGEIFERVKKHSSADEVEVLITGGHSALTRFANNTIHQNVAEENYVLSVRAVMSGKTARATTNKLDDESIRRTVQSAEAITRVQHEDPDLLPLVAPEEAAANAPAPVERHFEGTAALGPEDRAVAV